MAFGATDPKVFYAFRTVATYRIFADCCSPRQHRHNVALMTWRRRCHGLRWQKGMLQLWIPMRQHGRCGHAECGRILQGAFVHLVKQLLPVSGQRGEPEAYLRSGHIV